MTKKRPDSLEEKQAAMKRYSKSFDEAHGVFDDPKIQSLAKKPAPRPKAQSRTAKPARHSETPAERFVQLHKQYGVEPLIPAQLANDHDVTSSARYSKPPFVVPVPQLVKNVSKKNANDIESADITPGEMKAWREHLGMTPKQIATVLRVTERTVRHWEAGGGRIPFLLYWAMQQIKPSDLPTGYSSGKPTKYYKPEFRDAGQMRLQAILKSYAPAMKAQGVTSTEFRMWREYCMLMTVEQAGQLVRVPPATIKDWESGRAPIPFSMWWVMHVMLQDPENLLCRPGFHDFYIQHDNSIGPTLCSSRYPDVRLTPNDLYATMGMQQRLEGFKAEVNQAKAKAAELEAENTRLRQMLKAGTVAAELKAMHDHIGEMMRRMHTADIVALPEKENAEVISLRQASA